MQLLKGAYTCPEYVHIQSVLKIKHHVLSLLVLLLCYNININTVNTETELAQHFLLSFLITVSLCNVSLAFCGHFHAVPLSENCLKMAIKAE